MSTVLHNGILFAHAYTLSIIDLCLDDMLWRLTAEITLCLVFWGQTTQSAVSSWTRCSRLDVSLSSCLWMLSQHAERRGRRSNGIANDIAGLPREPPSPWGPRRLAPFIPHLLSPPHPAISSSVCSHSAVEDERGWGGRENPSLWPSALQKIKERAWAITVMHWYWVQRQQKQPSGCIYIPAPHFIWEI